MLYNWEFNTDKEKEILGETQESSPAPEITRDISVEQQDAIREIVSDKIIDINWRDFFHYATLFDTLDSTEDSGASVTANRLFMSASGTGVIDYVRFRRIYQNLLSFDKESRFRTAFDVGSPSQTTGRPMQNTQAYLGTGSTGTSYSEILSNGLGSCSHYGFYVENDSLYGITSDGSGLYSTVFLTKVNVYDLFFIEALHFPRERVDFYVSEASNAVTDPEVKPVIYKGALTKTLPTGHRKAVYEFSIKDANGATGDKDLDVGFFELIQRR